ncbi:hypothetical protein KVR01_008878 [Diaporthe batatas]|uniref:uncharacterized protein n=1 Tax=Diaporthe batatas TaxID=748121 RepID=UPI001D0568A6|nr:uncharacterized protein KVR01_008878 [Diaporthe batatas]KAG8160614.1 hypothetical protein KVR01_008878 [Diaporthe batatas]
MAEAVGLVAVTSSLITLSQGVHTSISKLREIKQPPGVIAELIAEINGLNALLKEIRQLALAETLDASVIRASLTPTLNEASMQATRLLENITSFTREPQLIAKRNSSRIASRWTRNRHKDQARQLLQQTRSLSSSLSLLATVSLQLQIGTEMKRNLELLASVASISRSETAQYYSSMDTADKIRLEIDEITRKTDQDGRAPTKLRIGNTKIDGETKISYTVHRQPKWVPLLLGNLSLTVDDWVTLRAIDSKSSLISDRCSQWSVRYVLPQWLAGYAMEFMTRPSLTNTVSFAFRLFKVSQSDRPIWRAIRHGNVEWLAQALSRGEWAPSDVLMTRRRDYSVDPLSYAVECSQPQVGKRMMQFGEQGSGRDFCAPNCASHKILFRSVATLEELHFLEDLVTDQEYDGLYLFQPQSNFVLYEGSPPSIAKESSRQWGYSPIHLAVVNSNFEILTQIAEGKADVDSRDEFGNTPLHLVMSASEFDASMAEALLDLGADVDSQDLLGRTPLHSALARGCLQSARLLLKNGANPNMRDELFGETPLNYLVSKFPASSSDHAALTLLCSFGADLDLPDYAGATPVMNAIKNPGGTTFFKSLVEYGARLDKTDNTGKSLLDMAVVWADVELIQYMGALRMWSYNDFRQSLRYLEYRTPASSWATTRHRGDLGEMALIQLVEPGRDISPNDEYQDSEIRNRSALESVSPAVDTSALDEERYSESQHEETLSKRTSPRRTHSMHLNDSKAPTVYEEDAKELQDDQNFHDAKEFQDTYSDIESEELTIPNSRTHITAASSITQSNNPASLQSQLQDFMSLLELPSGIRSILDSAPENSFISLSSFQRFANMVFVQFGMEFSGEHKDQSEAAAFLLRYSYVISSTVVLSTIQGANVKSPMKRAFLMNGNTPGLKLPDSDTLSGDWLFEFTVTNDPQLREWKSQLAAVNNGDTLTPGLDTDLDGFVDFGTPELRSLILSSQAFHRLRNRFQKFVHPEFFESAQYFLAHFNSADSDLQRRLTSFVAELSESKPPKLEVDLRPQTSRFDAVKLATEELTNMSWSWWPFSKPQRPLRSGQVRMSWTCDCGRSRSENVPREFGTFLATLIKQQANSSGQSGDPGQTPSSARNQISANKSPASSQSIGGGKGLKTRRNDAFTDDDNVHRSDGKASEPDGPREKWIFLMAKSTQLNLHQIDAKLHSGETFADALRQGYCRLRGRWKSLFGIDIFSHCDFVKFEKYIAEHYSNRGIGVPGSDIREYDFQPKPGDTLFADPPISPEHFKHIFYDCTGYYNRDGSKISQAVLTQDDSSNIFKKSISKVRFLFARRGRFPSKTVAKIPQRLSYFDEKGDNEEVFWGLLAREERSALRVCMWALIIFSPSIAFSFIYLFGKMDVDLQNATTLFAITLTIFGTFISFLLKDGGSGKNRG